MILATLCYVKRNGKTLMLHRVKKANDIHQGKWNGLGGKLEPGETPEDCVIREVKEESGFTIRAPRLKGIITFPGFDGEQDWYVFVYVARRFIVPGAPGARSSATGRFSGRLIDSDEGRLAWVDDRRLLDLPLWEGDRIFLRWLGRKKFFSAKFTYKNFRFVSHRVAFY